MTPEQQAKLQQVGQDVVDYISSEMEAAGFVDLKLALNVLCGVVAHYMAGIDDAEVRSTVFIKFSTELATMMEAVRRQGLHAQVVVKGKETEQ
jgi:hypothetical protein